jgi:hypothetical protein
MCMWPITYTFEPASRTGRHEGTPSPCTMHTHLLCTRSCSLRALPLSCVVLVISDSIFSRYLIYTRIVCEM